MKNDSFTDLYDLIGDKSERFSRVKRELLSGKHQCFVWQPLTSVYRIERQVLDDEIVTDRSLVHFDGPIPLSEGAIGRLLKSGKLHIREFTNEDKSEQYRLPEDVHDITIAPDDLLIRFNSEALKRWEVDEHLRIIKREGVTHRLGSKQSAALRCLLDGYRDGEPWQHGKTMLRAAGSDSFHVPDLFKRSSIWNEIVERDGHGMYRLREDVVQAIELNNP
ncbi:MAG: hypothetical protein ACPGN3_12375 [Opitutales bacterium]